MPWRMEPMDCLPSGQLGLPPMLGAIVPPAALHSSAVVGAAPPTGDAEGDPAPACPAGFSSPGSDRVAP
jgi:hypothetical protein